jgi:flagellar L-ring protein precursor FlgH
MQTVYKIQNEVQSMRKPIWLIGIVLAAFILSGCITEKIGLKKSETLPAWAAQKPVSASMANKVNPDPAGGASLWNESNYQEFFKDLRAFRVGDLVTVSIVETSKASKKAGTKTARDSSIDASIDNALGWENQLKYLTSLGNKQAKDDLKLASLAKASIQNNFTGSGETTRDESMTASITARVVEVTANGNLYIQGMREIKVNNEVQFMTLSGLIRPVDISPDNTILSSYVADAKISYSGRGAVSDKQRPGWLTRVIDFIWPF